MTCDCDGLMQLYLHACILLVLILHNHALLRNVSSEASSFLLASNTLVEEGTKEDTLEVREEDKEVGLEGEAVARRERGLVEA